jgi:hypothetical protein
VFNAILSIFSSECHKFLKTNAQVFREPVIRRTLQHGGFPYFDAGLQSKVLLSILTIALLAPGITGPGFQAQLYRESKRPRSSGG